MPWEAIKVKYWTICWKWILPYPCRKTKTKYCCSGMLKTSCLVLVGKKWFCCGGREHHWWSLCFGIGTTIVEDRICKNSIPDESEDCTEFIGVTIPPGSVLPPGSGITSRSYRLTQASITGGIGATIGGVIGAIAIGGTQQIGAGAIIGLIFGTGIGVGRRGGCMITLIAILIALLLSLLRFF